jgi:ribosomal protein S18 acetylase RimI-like enzyme
MITIRQGKPEDSEFLAKAIIEAEKSGTDLLSYAKIFGLPEKDVAGMLSEILAEDIPGSELCASAFLIAFSGDTPAGCVASWIEGAEGISSNIIKMNSLFYFLDKSKLALIKENIKIVETADIPREPGALQLESIYVAPEFRGQGITGKLIDRHIEIQRSVNTSIKKAQIQLMAENKNAISAYLRAGFAITGERTSEDPSVTRFLPWNTRILMEKEI